VTPLQREALSWCICGAWGGIVGGILYLYLSTPW